MSAPPDKLSIVVFSSTFERVHYALVMAGAAIASNTPVTLFFTMGAARALLIDSGWKRLPSDEAASAEAMDDRFKARGVGSFEELLSACVVLGVRFQVCEMGLVALGIDKNQLRPDVPLDLGGVVTFLADASKDGAMLFI
jgi:peroxiredoxin family protein